MSTYVLVINAGSSSLKYSLVDADTGGSPGHGLVERIGESVGALRHEGPNGTSRVEVAVADHEAALRLALDAFAERGPDLSAVTLAAVGHRVVHGGDQFSAPVLVDDELVDTVRDLIPLAPLHNPANLEGLQVARRLFPDVPHVAVFDTAFHHTLPAHAYTYAVPRSWSREHRIRRYGFHGTSVSFVSRAAAHLLDRPVEEVRLIVLHLGNGASVTAVEDGRSVETSMGFTPLEGLVMGTRSGDIDPALPAHLAREAGWTIEEIDRQLNRESGLKGLVGHNDVRELTRLRDEGDPDAMLAFDVYCHRIRKYIGAYYAVLGDVDAIVFTGGVGENGAEVRAATTAGLEGLGVALSDDLNARSDRTARDVASEESRVRVLVVPTDEEWEIARQSVEVVRTR